MDGGSIYVHRRKRETEKIGGVFSFPVVSSGGICIYIELVLKRTLCVYIYTSWSIGIYIYTCPSILRESCIQ